MARQKGLPTPKYDWNALKAEWLSGNETLNQFREKHHLSRDWFYRKVEEGGWIEAKDKIVARAMTKVGNDQSNQLAKQYGEYTNIWKASKAQALTILKRTVDENGRVTRPLNTQELQQLVKAVYQILQGESFITGGPTERIEQKSLHYEIVQMIKEAEKAKNE